MRKLSVVSGLVAAVLSCAWLFPAEAYLGDHSADFVSKITGQDVSGKIYVSDDKSRMEIGRAIVITRADKSVIWMVLPDTQVYMELPLDAHYLVFGSEEVPGESARELVETEVVDGTMADKYRILFDLGARKDDVYSWIPPGTVFPIKTAAGDGSWEMTFSNITAVAQPESLFEVPLGYKKFAADMLALPDPAAELLPAALDE